MPIFLSAAGACRFSFRPPVRADLILPRWPFQLVVVVVYSLIALAVLSILLNLWQWFAGWRFPMRKTLPLPNSFPALSILKPLKGRDLETEACLRTWFRQDYPARYELLFGVASAEDTACDMVSRLIAEHPNQPAQLVICDPILGPNAKVSSLCYLLQKAAHENIVASDADVAVQPGFLRRLISTAATAPEQIALTSCFYVLREPRSLPMRLESVAVNSDFWTQVLQGNMLKRMEFALGAVIATSKTELRAIGGFEALLHYLADDYYLGNRIARNGTGARLTICPDPVDCHAPVQGWRGVWKHQLRWARTIRACQPVPYFFSILGNATLWPVLGFAVAKCQHSAALLGTALLLRMVTAASNWRKLTGEPGWVAGLLAPVKDIFQIPLWAMAFLGNKIDWRGSQFRVEKGGKLTPLA